MLTTFFLTATAAITGETKTREWKAWEKVSEKRNRPAKVKVPEAAGPLGEVAAAAVGKEVL